MRNIIDLYGELETFHLDERFSEHLREFYYGFRSLVKYWLLTKELISVEIYRNSKLLNDDALSDGSEQEFDLSEGPLICVDGEEMENDYLVVPFMQRNLTICTTLSLVEALMKNVCAEIDANYMLNGKGSYIQQYHHFIRNHSTIRVPKKYMKSFETFGHIRNSFLHQLNHQAIPQTSIDHMDLLTGPFSELKDGLSNSHVELFLRTISDFGQDFQEQYWKDFEVSNV